MRTSNPALNPNTFAQEHADPNAPTMTVQGTIFKTGMLLGLLVIAAAWTWHLASTAAAASGAADAQATAAAGFQAVMGYTAVGAIGGFIVALITIFKPNIAPITAPIYAILEGLFLGGISAYINTMYAGVAMQAVGCTFGVMAVMLVLYSTGIIKPTKTFVMGVAAATGGIFLFYLVAIVASLFGFTAMSSVLAFNNGGMISIGFSVLVVIIAALNLVLDFATIDQGSQQGAPRYMEWYGAFSLMVTLVWLYLEILRLLSKLQSR